MGIKDDVAKAAENSEEQVTMKMAELKLAIDKLALALNSRGRGNMPFEFERVSKALSNLHGAVNVCSTFRHLLNK